MTDKLKSYEAAKKQVMKSVEHRQHQGLNNQAENSHQPTRTRERRMRLFKSLGQAQRSLSALDQFAITFTPSNIDSPHNDTENNCANDLKIGEKLLG